MKIRFDLNGRLDGVTRTPQGGIRATANLTRTGVFTYYNADGTKTRELRHPDDIFKPDALESMKGATVTIGHPGLVTPGNYGEHATGHVHDDVRADGKLVKATITVNRADGVAFIEDQMAKGGVELSMGYQCDVEQTDGSFDGETYDARQSGHRYNHVAMGPVGWGRAGSEVRITLDEAGHADRAPYAAAMTTKTDDNKDMQARLDAVSGERDALRSRVDSLTAEVAQLKTDLVGAKALNGKMIDPSSIDRLVANRVALETSARKVLGATAKLDGKSDREVMIEALAKCEPKFDAKDRSDEYVRARFDASTETAQAADQAVADLAAAATPGTKQDDKGATTTADGTTKSPLDIANEKFEAEQAKCRSAGAPAGSLTRK